MDFIENEENQISFLFLDTEKHNKIEKNNETIKKMKKIFFEKENIPFEKKGLFLEDYLVLINEKFGDENIHYIKKLEEKLMINNDTLNIEFFEIANLDSLTPLLVSIGFLFMIAMLFTEIIKIKKMNIKEFKLKIRKRE